MATIRLVPSTYEVNSTFLTVSDANNMYTNTDSNTYATITNTQNGTTSYYIYIRGFNFDAIPSDATVDSFTVKLKGYQNRGNTSSSYSPKLCHGTSQITSTCSPLTTTVNTYTFTNVGETWERIKNYGNDFGVRINCRRANRNQQATFYIYMVLKSRLIIQPHM